ncbi:MAG: hypothetical protein R3F55_20345 [Alphaproteobacteria bacterium]
MDSGSATHTRTYRRLVQGTTINGTTLLSTDYLNHFNEFVMMLELVADMPDMAPELEQWQPKTYVQHFADSGFSHKDLAIAAYDHVPAEFRRPFDETIAAIDAMICETVPRVGALLVEHESEAARHHMLTIAREMRGMIERASAIINGARVEDLDGAEGDSTMGQGDIDALFD